MMTIRLADHDDIPTLVSLMREFYAEAGLALTDDAAASAFGALLDDPEAGWIWIAEDNGVADGHLVLTTGFSMEYGARRGFVDDFFVRPAARNRGVGAALLAAMTAHARAEGIRTPVVETGLPGHPARSLYLRAGFLDSDRTLLHQPLGPALHEG